MKKLPETVQRAVTNVAHPEAAHHESDAAYGRDRLLAALTLMVGCGLAIALPFALRAGAEFFLPVTAATTVLSPSDVALIAAVLTAMRNKAAYVNVHTATSPGGEIRGQLKLDGGHGGGDR